jgi:hypothetical protein
MITPKINPSTQQNPTKAIVNASGGPPGWVWDGGESGELNDEVGITYGVGVIASGAPETGTMVGTNVGVGWAVG